MATAFLSLANRDHPWFDPQVIRQDVALFTTLPEGRVLIGGGSNRGRQAAISVGETDVDVHGVASAALVKSFGLTLTMPPGVTTSNDLTSLLAGANNPSSNPFVWSSNALARLETSANAALEMASYTSNALIGFPNAQSALESAFWTSNQITGLREAMTQAERAKYEAEYASNASTVALRRADLSSNAAYLAMSIASSITGSYPIATFASNAAVYASNAARATSNLAFEYLPVALASAASAGSAAVWASNEAYLGAEDARYASNALPAIENDLILVKEKATSAYYTATTTIGKAAWASNLALLASKDALNAVAAVTAYGDSTSAVAASAYASNEARIALSNTAGMQLRLFEMSNVLYPQQSRAMYSSNVVASLLAPVQAASNAANTALSAASGAVAKAQAAFSLATDSISASRGGAVSGTLDFSGDPAGSIVGVSAIGVGTSVTNPIYPVQVDSMATDENVSIWVSGSIQQLSDVREKVNIDRMGSALERLQAIRGYTYNYRNSGKRNAGVLAQEVREVLPEAVHMHPESSNLSVSYNSLIPLMIEAIHDLCAIVARTTSEPKP